MINAQADEMGREISRLADTKRRALAIADERSKENVALRAEVERFRARAEERGIECAGLRAERDQYLKSSVDYGNLSERLRAALLWIIDCTHRPNPTDQTRIDVAPGKHRHFQAGIKNARKLLTVEQSATRTEEG